MGKLKTYDQFVNENLKAVIGSPVKYIKIKNNLKKFQKAKVKQALNDVDFAKRKNKGAEEMTAGQKEVLKQANIAKNAALADTSSAITQRMKDIATTEPLKKVVSLGTTKARLAANQVAFKSADGEEKKKLKIKANELQKKAADLTGELKDYESTAKKEETPAKTSAQNTDDIKTDTKTKPKTDTETKATGEPAAEGEPKTKQSAADKKKAEKKQELSNKIGDAMTAIERAKAQAKGEEEAKAEAIEKLNSVKGTEEEGEASRAVAAFATAKKSREDAIEKLQKNIKDLQKQQKDLNESINEGMYTASQLTNMLLDDIRKGIRGIHAPDEKELKTLALKRLKMKRVMKRDIQDTINGWENSLADARKDKIREYMFSDVKATKGKIPESFEYVAESVSEKFARLRPNL